ncbi:MAG: 4-hydroxybenzoate octaprenyltransferase [Proteobacteria bacterium]|nr:4-hydroxybenzoate octaprenyltransferase [Pseudomonadota bacterium]
MSETRKKPAQVDGQVADAVDKNWVDRFCPAWSRPYLRLSRADRPAGTWLLLIPCWWGLFMAILGDPNGATWADAWYFIACAIGAFLMRGAGCTWNDISDRNIDGQVERTKSRPIPSGQVTTKQAAVWMIIQAIIAFGVLLTFNNFAILIGIIALAPVVIYPFAKRFTWWPQVFLGVAFNWGALLGWAAHTGSLSWAPVLLYFAGISWTLFYDTIYAHQDKDDDALIGVKSTARLFGVRTYAWLSKFQIATITLMTFALLSAILDHAGPITLSVSLIGVWAFGMHLMWQLRRLDIDDPAICLKLFRENRDAGLIPVAFWGILLIFKASGIAS